jgi:glycosyltransferase involved in cell wall biosynthesis
LRASGVVRNNWAYFKTFRKNVEDIKKIITDKGIDVVQVCGLMHIHALFACRELGIPLVWQLLGTFAPYPLRTLFTPLVAATADQVMTTGIRTAKQHPFHQFFSRKHTVFYPPVDTRKFQFDTQKRKQARKWLGVPDDAFLIGTVGNQNKTKGHEYFIDIAELLNSDPNLYFRIVGAHTPSHAEYYKREVIDRAGRKSLFEGNKFSITESELPIDVIMSAFDMLLLTSRVEGMPTVVLEAMSVGLPIVSSRVGSIREVLDEGKNGFTYALEDVQGACARIRAIKNNEALMASMAKNNRAKALREFDVSVCAEQHINAYEKAMGRLL